MEMVFRGLSSTLQLYLLAMLLAIFPILSKHSFLSFLSSLIEDFPIDSRVMNRSTIGLELALPGYLPETT